MKNFIFIAATATAVAIVSAPAAHAQIITGSYPSYSTSYYGGYGGLNSVGYSLGVGNNAGYYPSYYGGYGNGYNNFSPYRGGYGYGRGYGYGGGYGYGNRGYSRGGFGGRVRR